MLTITLTTANIHYAICTVSLRPSKQCVLNIMHTLSITDAGRRTSCYCSIRDVTGRSILH